MNEKSSHILSSRLYCKSDHVTDTGTVYYQIVDLILKTRKILVKKPYVKNKAHGSVSQIHIYPEENMKNQEKLEK